MRKIDYAIIIVIPALAEIASAYPNKAINLVGRLEMVVLIVGILGIYFLPSIVAYRRQHHNTMAIFILDLFLGWTFLGWVIALVWSSTVVRTFVGFGPALEYTHTDLDGATHSTVRRKCRWLLRTLRSTPRQSSGGTYCGIVRTAPARRAGSASIASRSAMANSASVKAEMAIVGDTNGPEDPI